MKDSYALNEEHWRGDGHALGATVQSIIASSFLIIPNYELVTNIIMIKYKTAYLNLLEQFSLGS